MTMKNQTEVYSIQMEQNEEQINNVSIENMESISKKKEDKDDGLLVRGVPWITNLIFNCLAGYWITKVIITYRSEPVMATVNIIQNKTFQWPRITIQPSELCGNNLTTVWELREAYNFTPPSTPGSLMPFEITSNSFNWKVNNVSEIYLQGRYTPPFTYMCKYTSATRNQTSCFAERMGNWETYNTQYIVKETFTPVLATTILDNIFIMIKSNICDNFIVTIHPSTDRFYDAHPSAHSFPVSKGARLEVYVAVEEFHKVSTRSSPCNEDINYSQAQCYENKMIEYKIKRAGCYFPGITGYHPKVQNYPECKNVSSFRNFVYWHHELFDNQFKYDDLEKIKNECDQPCHSKRYFATETIKEKRGGIGFLLHMDSSAMSYLSVNEQRAMTADMLLGNVGGTLGLFLGISCLTGISAIQYVVRKTQYVVSK